MGRDCCCNRSAPRGPIGGTLEPLNSGTDTVRQSTLFLIQGDLVDNFREAIYIVPKDRDVKVMAVNLVSVIQFVANNPEYVVVSLRTAVPNNVGILIPGVTLAQTTVSITAGLAVNALTAFETIDEMATPVHLVEGQLYYFQIEPFFNSSTEEGNAGEYTVAVSLF